jgi:hypothetical protein
MSGELSPTRRPTARVRGSLATAGESSVLIWLLPCFIAALYLGVFVLRFPRSVAELGWNSDFASGFTVPQTLGGTGAGGHTVLGTYPLYAALWFGLLTARLPFHRQLWEIAPTALFILTALTVGWCVAQIATRRAAALAVLIGLVVSPAALGVFIAPVAHNTVYPCTALLGAYLIWLARGERRAPTTALVVPVIATIVLGVCLASDVLLLVTGIVPFALTALLAGLRRDRRSRMLALYALTTVAAAFPIAELTSTVMSHLGYSTNTPREFIAPLSLLSAHAQLLLRGIEQIFNVYLGSGPLHAELGVGCAVITATALSMLLLAGACSASSFLISGLRAGQQTTPAQLSVSVHTIYWVGSALSACGAYVLSNFLNSTHEAFYLTVIFSVAAVIPPFAFARSRWLLPVATSIFFTASLLGLTNPNPLGGLGRLAPYESDVLKVARAYHATLGYAGYWDSSSLTWSSREAVRVRPVFACENPAGADLCIFSEETVASWYAPARRNTFLLVDSNEGYLESLPRGLGRRLAGYEFGTMKMYVYPYDIASRLGPASSPSL